MAKLDVAREEIGYLKLWLGIVIVSDISLVGWVALNSGTVPAHLLAMAVLAIGITSAGMLLLHRRIETRIRSMREL
ncbi:MAG: hypothetical protein ACT4P3_16590 [Betaproteobacteria bacterium]